MTFYLSITKDQLLADANDAQHNTRSSFNPTVTPAFTGKDTFKVFISYKKADCAPFSDTNPFGDGTALRIKSHFDRSKDRTYEVFVDDNSIKVGENWSEKILDGLTRCDVFVALISTHYADSIWCIRELQEVDRLMKHILPIFHSGTYPPKGQTLILSEKQSIPSGKPLKATVDTAISDADFATVMGEVLSAINDCFGEGHGGEAEAEVKAVEAETDVKAMEAAIIVNV